MKLPNLIHIVIGIVCIPFAGGAPIHETWADSQEAPPTHSS